LASKIAWYSAVSGGCCPRPGGFAGSKRGSSEAPGATARSHWPRKSGYFASSNACAVLPAVHSIAASATAVIKPPWSMPLLPFWRLVRRLPR